MIEASRPATLSARAGNHIAEWEFDSQFSMAWQLSQASRAKNTVGTIIIQSGEFGWNVARVRAGRAQAAVKSTPTSISFEMSIEKNGERRGDGRSVCSRVEWTRVK